jgi:hypothetical protein
MKTKILHLLALLTMMTATTVLAADNWKEKLQKELPLLGHRNWIAGFLPTGVRILECGIGETTSGCHESVALKQALEL